MTWYSNVVHELNPICDDTTGKRTFDIKHSSKVINSSSYNIEEPIDAITVMVKKVYYGNRLAKIAEKFEQEVLKKNKILIMQNDYDFFAEALPEIDEHILEYLNNNMDNDTREELERDLKNKIYDNSVKRYSRVVSRYPNFRENIDKMPSSDMHRLVVAQYAKEILYGMKDVSLHTLLREIKIYNENQKQKGEKGIFYGYNNDSTTGLISIGVDIPRLNMPLRAHVKNSEYNDFFVEQGVPRADFSNLPTLMLILTEVDNFKEERIMKSAEKADIGSIEAFMQNKYLLDLANKIRKIRSDNDEPPR